MTCHHPVATFEDGLQTNVLSQLVGGRKCDALVQRNKQKFKELVWFHDYIVTPRASVTKHGKALWGEWGWAKSRASHRGQAFQLPVTSSVLTGRCSPVCSFVYNPFSTKQSVGNKTNCARPVCFSVRAEKLKRCGGAHWVNGLQAQCKTHNIHYTFTA